MCAYIHILKLSWYIEREKERKEKREQRGMHHERQEVNQIFSSW